MNICAFGIRNGSGACYLREAGPLSRYRRLQARGCTGATGPRHGGSRRLSEADALVLDRSMRFSEQETALEQGWLLSELEQRFGYRLEDLARRFDRSVSWVSRRLALVEQLPEAVQQRVRAGEIAAHVAMKYLAPVARTNP